MTSRKYCGIISCENNLGVKDPNIHVFRTNSMRNVAIWRVALHNLGLIFSGHKPMVCSLHFHPSDFAEAHRLKRNAVPSIGIPSHSISIEIDPMDTHEATNLAETADPGNIDMVKLEPVVEIEMTPAYNETNTDQFSYFKPKQMKAYGTNSQNKKASNTSCTKCLEYSAQVIELQEKNALITQKFKDLNLEFCKLKKLLGQQNEGRVKSKENQESKKRLSNRKKCEVCFKRVTNLQQHICMDQPEVNCEYCSATFKTTIDLSYHLNDVKHPDAKLYECDQCTMAFPSASLLQFHQSSKRSHPQLPDDASFECYICKVDFEKRSEVKRHIRQHGLRDKKCEICDEMLTSNELTWHVCDGGSSIKCEYCSSSFNATTELLQHLKIEHDDKVLCRCRKCNRYFGMEHLREIHEQHHSEHRPFICDICSKGFSVKPLLKAHMEIHSSERNYLCSECGKGFKTAETLRTHRRSHAIGTFQCADCPKLFRYHGGLKYHIERFHQNVKYKCNECSAIYPTLPALNKHINLRHKNKSVIKRHACTFCPMKFREKSSLEIHLRKHNGDKPFTCEYCDRKYAYQQDLKKHLQTHVGNNIYKCEECGEGFRLQTELRRHSIQHFKQDKLVAHPVETDQ